MLINDIFKDWKIDIKKYNPSNSPPMAGGDGGEGAWMVV